MKNLIFLFSILSCGLAACQFKGFSQPYSATVQVVDMNGKPMKDRAVSLYVGFRSYYGSVDSRQTVLTDAKGIVKYNYNLSVSDSHTDFATFQVKEDTIWKAIAYAEHSVGVTKEQKTIEKTFVLEMDTLADFKARIRKTIDSVTNISFSAYISSDVNSQDSYTRKNNIYRSFYRVSIESLRGTDTLIQFKAFSNSGFRILKSFKQSLAAKEVIIPKGFKRDSIILIEVP